ncbi:MAG: hypothetical protein ACREE0_06470 [Phenylobacterium sp.]
MILDPTGSILVVCADEAASSSLLSWLHDGGFNALGPVSTAGMALALAAQSAPGAAILVGETTGRRDAGALAAELTRIWGVDCHVMSNLARDDADPAGASGLPPGVAR